MVPEKAQQSHSSERTVLEGILHYIAILLKYKWLILIISGLAAALVVLYSLISIILPPKISPLPNKYTAQAVLLVQGTPTGSLDSVIASLGLALPEQAGSPTTAPDYGQIALMVLNSKIIVDQLIDDFDIVRKYRIQEGDRTSARTAVLKGAQFNYTKASGVLTVSYEATDPVYAKDMVNRMVELLNDWFVSKGGTTKLKQKNMLEQKIAEVSADIAKLEAQIRDFQKQYGVLTVEELAASQSKVLADLRAQQVLKEMEIRNYTQFTKIEDSHLMRLRAENENIKGLISQNEKQFSGLDLPTLSLQFARLKMALDIQTRIFESMSEQYEVTKLTLESEPVFQILDLAEVPDRKSGPHRSTLCLVTILLAALGGVLLAFLLNMVKGIQNDPSKLIRIRGGVE
jgi:tyrosine-protein kinase Etk/Wzc